MAKQKAHISLRILDIDKFEAIKDLFNELLDTLETLRLSDVEKDNKGFELSDIRKERTGYINRFADIITDEKEGG